MEKALMFVSFVCLLRAFVIFQSPQANMAKKTQNMSFSNTWQTAFCPCPQLGAAFHHPTPSISHTFPVPRLPLRPHAMRRNQVRTARSQSQFPSSTPPPNLSSDSDPEVRSAKQKQQYIQGALAYTLQSQFLLAKSVTASGDQESVLNVTRELADGCIHAMNDSVLALEEHFSILILAAPTLTGLVGMHMALQIKRELGKKMDVAVLFLDGLEVVHVRDELVDELRNQLKQEKITVLDSLPSTYEFYYEVIVDAIFGVELHTGIENEPSEGQSQGQGEGEFDRARYPQIDWIISKLSSCKRRMVSLDLPTGWRLENGPSELDIRRDEFIKPDLLCSFGVPKKGSRYFNGPFHYIVGESFQREIYSSLDSKLNIEIHLLTKGKPIHPFQIDFNKLNWGKNTGQQYGGGFMATTFSKNSRRQWVDEDSLDDIVDDLD